MGTQFEKQMPARGYGRPGLSGSAPPPDPVRSAGCAPPYQFSAFGFEGNSSAELVCEAKLVSVLARKTFLLATRQGL